MIAGAIRTTHSSSFSPRIFAGPNIATGHTSAIYTEELQVSRVNITPHIRSDIHIAQINYILKFVKPILDGLVTSFSVTPRATDAYNDLIQARLARSVWVQCTSWYRAGGEGKVSSIFPGPMFLFAWWVRRPRWEDYAVKAPSKKWARRVWREKWLRRLSPAHYLSLLVGGFVTWLSG
jgi:hypothetical protein